MPRRVWRRAGAWGFDEVEAEGAVVCLAFWSLVLNVSRGYNDRSTVSPAIAPDYVGRDFVSDGKQLGGINSQNV